MVKPRKRRNETVEQFIERAASEYYKNGYHLAEIADKLDCDLKTIYNAIVDKKYRIVSADERAIMIYLYNQGFSYSDIAKQTGRSRPCVKTRIIADAECYVENNSFYLPDKEISNIRKYFLAGKTIKWISNKIKISERAVRYRLQKMGIYKANYSVTIPLTKSEETIIKSMIKNNENIMSIALYIGRPCTIVKKYINSLK